MPRHFTSAERDTIRMQLVAAGISCFTRYGLRGARVEDMCREVGVAKGTFYSFFDNKEQLFLAIADTHDRRYKDEILSFLDTFEGDARAHIEAFFDMLMDKILADPLLAILSNPEDLAALMRKIPPDRMAHEERKDTEFLTRLCACLTQKRLIAPPSPETLGGLMALLVALVLQKPLMSEAMFSRAVAVLRSSFVDTLTRGSDDRG